MKIAFIGQKGVPAKTGGIERYLENLSVRLAAKGHEVFVYSRRYYSRGMKEYKGVKIISLPSVRSKNLETISHTFFASLDAIFRRVDLINFQAIGPATLIWLIKIFKPKTPVVFTFHCQDYYHQKWGRFARFYLKWGESIGCRLADKVIVTSRILADYVKKTYGFAPIYIPYGAEIQEKIPPTGIRRWGLEKDNYVAYIGRLVRHKGAHYLIAAFKQIETEKKLAIVGASAYTDAYVRELKALAADDQRIIFTGNQSGPILKELFANAAVFVQPSEYEGLSVALLEAMGWRLPCLASDIPQNKEALAGTGPTFKNRDANDLKLKLEGLLEHPEERRRWGQLAAARIKNQYNWDRITKEIIDVFIKTAAERKKLIAPSLAINRDYRG